MRLALREARRAEGRTFPNPPVGAVVFHGERVLGRGHTRPVGGAHAEIVALDRARRRFGAHALRGASLAVTLEPCSHHGRTPPCTDAILAAGIARVWFGHGDPNPVAGPGARVLRARGVAVESGVLADACRAQHRGFLSVLERGRPHVSLKLGATLDGRIATARGESRWITGEAARARVQRLRDRADAVMVGALTARLDDPELAVRRAGRIARVPIRVLADSRLRVPLTARLFADPHAARTWVLATAAAPAAARRAREARGARVLEVPSRNGRVEPAAALRRLAREGITSLLVEGGGELAAALLRAGLVDEVHWFAAPSLLGGDARSALGPLGVPRLTARVVLQDPTVTRVGEDVYVHGRVSQRATRARRPRRGSRRA